MVTVLLWTISVWIYKIRMRYFDLIRGQHEVEQKLKKFLSRLWADKLNSKVTDFWDKSPLISVGGGKYFGKTAVSNSGSYSSATLSKWERLIAILFLSIIILLVLCNMQTLCCLRPRNMKHFRYIKGNMICVSKFLYRTVAVLRIVYYFKHSWNYPSSVETEVMLLFHKNPSLLLIFS